ncbi:hypothetical protein UO65_4960 [Actinokineospora spheciospongiae]|uniref:Uncharacterized protein n=1 Tax=Actinokineospora spheciospongiae TaxID=909613 RepID=W7ITK0_9PSEU|nr:hypothetical protein UO65_4960 [Actinokineospora spheciospongiae]
MQGLFLGRQETISSYTQRKLGVPEVGGIDPGLTTTTLGIGGSPAIGEHTPLRPLPERATTFRLLGD